MGAVDRFGGMAPFQFHQGTPSDLMATDVGTQDSDAMDISDSTPSYQGDPFTGQYVNHQIYVKPKSQPQ